MSSRQPSLADNLIRTAARHPYRLAIVDGVEELPMASTRKIQQNVLRGQHAQLYR